MNFIKRYKVYIQIKYLNKNLNINWYVEIHISIKNLIILKLIIKFNI